MIEITEEQREVLKLAIETYGEEKQIDMCIKEMAELTKALLKLRWGIADVEEETADVEIMIAQLEIIFDAGRIQSEANKKIKRLAQRLHKEV